MSEVTTKPRRGGARPWTGAPTLYTPEVCEEMLDFFDIEPYEVRIVNDEDGNPKEVIVPSKFPTFEAFAVYLGISRKTLFNWREGNPDFKRAWDICRTIQNNYILVNGMAGTTNPGFTRLAAINLLKWREKHDVTSANKQVPTTFTLQIGDE